MDEKHYADELEIARNCRGYGMCKIDSLKTGVCKPGKKHVFAAYYPYGRLKIFQDFLSGELPLTDRLEHIVQSCNFCGMCNVQCYFITEMVPQNVMKAMKDVLEERLKKEEKVKIPSDEVLEELISIVGPDWASNDPAVLLSYSSHGFLSHLMKKPFYVALPADTAQVSAIVTYAAQNDIPYLPITSGTNFSNLAIGKGIIIDLNRLKSIEIDELNYCAHVGAGVLAYELQKEALPKGLRMSIGEGAAGICSNQVTTGIHSLFSYKYGMMADSYLEAELVMPDGRIVRTSSSELPNLFNTSDFRYDAELPYICTGLTLKLHKPQEDETVIVIPFKEFEKALNVLKQLSERGIGEGCGLLSVELLKSFLALTMEDEENFYDIAKDYLKINYGLFLILNELDLTAFKKLFPDLVYLERESISKIIKGIPAITSVESMQLVETIMDEDEPYAILFSEMLEYFLSQIELDDGEIVALMQNIGDERLSKSMVKLYKEPEFSDLYHWLTYRMFAPRMARHLWFEPKLLCTTFDDHQVVNEVCKTLKEVGDAHQVENYLCYVMPIDFGKRLFIEYDYYYDSNDKKKLRNVKKAFHQADKEIDALSKQLKGIYPFRHTFYRGLQRKDLFLYHSDQSEPDSSSSSSEP